jgi:hypothetical protein
MVATGGMVARRVDLCGTAVHTLSLPRSGSD